MYYVNKEALAAELARLNWGVTELAAIWRVSRDKAAACLAQPQQISCYHMLLLQQATGWSGKQAAEIFFAGEM